MLKLLRSFALLCLLAAPAFAVLPSDTRWNMHTGGSASNSGCFQLSGAGTNYTLQDAAQYTFTDLVLVTTTTISSASHSFDTADEGNCINITAGSGFTPGRYMMQSTAAGVATLDRAAGTLGSTGGTFFVGGAVANLNTIIGTIVSGNTVCVKTGTYTITSGVTGIGAVDSVQIIGYDSTCGDIEGGTITGDENEPVFQTSGNGITLMTFSNASLNGLVVKNFILDCNSQTSSAGLAGGNGPKMYFNIRVRNCKGTSIALSSATCVLCTVELQSTGAGIVATGVNNRCVVCDVRNPTSTASHGVQVGTSAFLVCEACISEGNASSSGDGFNVAGSGVFDGVTCYNAGGDCFEQLCATNCDPVVITNSLFYTAVGYCISVTGGQGEAFILADHNGLGNCTAGARNNITAGGNDVTITADPFTDKDNDDFSLNSTAGGGAALRGAGFQHTMPLQ